MLAPEWKSDSVSNGSSDSGSDYWESKSELCDFGRSLEGLNAITVQVSHQSHDCRNHPS